MDFLYGIWCKLFVPIDKQYINPNKIKTTENESIRIVSYNVKAMFAYYNRRRIKDLVNYIESLFIERKTDIVCLQEAFELDFYNQLYAMCAKNRLNIVHPPLERTLGIGENSGLVTISRHPVTCEKFIRYEEATGLCWFANKGAHYMTVSLGSKKSLRLVNTHLQSDNETIAINQFAKLIDNIVFDGAMIVGDLNMGFDTVLQLCKKLDHVKCVNLEKEITFPETRDQLDYFLLYNLDLDCSFSVLSDVELSDHYPILTSF
jgi:endonuclease/exonuclease/phosphatase family metal-dependent hydrolase